jgi:methyltransferase (TIGR00027 family)
MRTGKPSTTASFVATMRGLAGHEREPIVTDPYARSLVGGPFRLGLMLADRVPRAAAVAMQAASLLSRGKIRHLELRTRAIDDVLAREATTSPQLVILGAGLDARAHRMPELARTTVFEVDHPSTQAEKRARLASIAGADPDRVRWVAVDFERDRLEDALLTSGFDRGVSATFLWEGVTMYLTRDAVEATLASVGAVAAVGSALAITYRSIDLHWEGVLANAAVRVVGEPFRLQLAPSDLAALLATHGFVVESDESSVEWGARYLGRPVASVGERLVVARRREVKTG